MSSQKTGASGSSVHINRKENNKVNKMNLEIPQALLAQLKQSNLTAVHQTSSSLSTQEHKAAIQGLKARIQKSDGPQKAQNQQFEFVPSRPAANDQNSSYLPVSKIRAASSNLKAKMSPSDKVIQTKNVIKVTKMAETQPSYEKQKQVGGSVMQYHHNVGEPKKLSNQVSDQLKNSAPKSLERTLQLNKVGIKNRTSNTQDQHQKQTTEQVPPPQFQFKAPASTKNIVSKGKGFEGQVVSRKTIAESLQSVLINKNALVKQLQYSATGFGVENMGQIQNTTSQNNSSSNTTNTTAAQTREQVSNLVVQAVSSQMQTPHGKQSIFLAAKASQNSNVTSSSLNQTTQNLNTNRGQQQNQLNSNRRRKASVQGSSQMSGTTVDRIPSAGNNSAVGMKSGNKAQLTTTFEHPSQFISDQLRQQFQTTQGQKKLGHSFDNMQSSSTSAQHQQQQVLSVKPKKAGSSTISGHRIGANNSNRNSAVKERQNSKVRQATNSQNYPANLRLQLVADTSEQLRVSTAGDSINQMLSQFPIQSQPITTTHQQNSSRQNSRQMVKSSGGGKGSSTTAKNTFTYKQHQSNSIISNSQQTGGGSNKIHVSTTARGHSSGIHHVVTGGGQKSVTNRKNNNRLHVGNELGEFQGQVVPQMHLTGASSATNKVKKTFKFETASNLMLQETTHQHQNHHKHQVVRGSNQVENNGSVFASSIDYDQQSQPQPQQTSALLNDSSTNVPTPTQRKNQARARRQELINQVFATQIKSASSTTHRGIRNGVVGSQQQTHQQQSGSNPNQNNVSSHTIVQQQQNNNTSGGNSSRAANKPRLNSATVGKAAAMKMVRNSAAANQKHNVTSNFGPSLLQKGGKPQIKEQQQFILADTNNRLSGALPTKKSGEKTTKSVSQSKPPAHAQYFKAANGPARNNGTSNGVVVGSGQDQMSNNQVSQGNGNTAITTQGGNTSIEIKDNSVLCLLNFNIENSNPNASSGQLFGAPPNENQTSNPHSNHSHPINTQSLPFQLPHQLLQNIQAQTQMQQRTQNNQNQNKNNNHQSNNEASMSSPGHSHRQIQNNQNQNSGHNNGVQNFSPRIIHQNVVNTSQRSGGGGTKIVGTSSQRKRPVKQASLQGGKQQSDVGITAHRFEDKKALRDMVVNQQSQINRMNQQQSFNQTQQVSLSNPQKIAKNVTKSQANTGNVTQRIAEVLNQTTNSALGSGQTGRRRINTVNKANLENQVIASLKMSDTLEASLKKKSVRGSQLQDTHCSETPEHGQFSARLRPGQRRKSQKKTTKIVIGSDVADLVPSRALIPRGNLSTKNKRTTNAQKLIRFGHEMTGSVLDDEESSSVVMVAHNNQTRGAKTAKGKSPVSKVSQYQTNNNNGAAGGGVTSNQIKSSQLHGSGSQHKRMHSLAADSQSFVPPNLQEIQFYEQIGVHGTTTYQKSPDLNKIDFYPPSQIVKQRSQKQQAQNNNSGEKINNNHDTPNFRRQVASKKPGYNVGGVTQKQTTTAPAEISLQSQIARLQANHGQKALKTGSNLRTTTEGIDGLAHPYISNTVSTKAPKAQRLPQDFAADKSSNRRGTNLVTLGGIQQALQKEAQSEKEEWNETVEAARNQSAMLNKQIKKSIPLNEQFASTSVNPLYKAKRTKNGDEPQLTAEFKMKTQPLGQLLKAARQQNYFVSNEDYIDNNDEENNGFDIDSLENNDHLDEEECQVTEPDEICVVQKPADSSNPQRSNLSQANSTNFNSNSIGQVSPASAIMNQGNTSTKHKNVSGSFILQQNLGQVSADPQSSQKQQVVEDKKVEPYTTTEQLLGQALRREQGANVNQVSTKVVEPKEEQIDMKSFEWPMTVRQTLRNFKNSGYLTYFEKTELLDYQEVYFIGHEAAQNKIQGKKTSKNFNFGFDDDQGDYQVVLKDHLAFRFEVLDFLGKGSFGQALKCLDHKTGEVVAVKIIKNKKSFQPQALVELRILQHLQAQDPEDTCNIIQIKDHCIFREHLIISFELFSINLYEWIKNNNFEGVSLSLIRRFAIQILQSLKFLQEEDLIHCDLKPENILLKSPDKSGIKIIDFGSSCFSHQRMYSYIQSRFYRAPEIIIGIPYTTAIDMWSFGCILIELYTGVPIFPGESEQEQLALIMQVFGAPSMEVLSKAQRRDNFFIPDTNEPIELVQDQEGGLRIPGSRPLEYVIGKQSESFFDFVTKCLTIDPEQRISPLEALQHPWILEGLPRKVLINHQRMLGLDVPSESELDQSHLGPQQQDLSQQQLVEDRHNNYGGSALPSQPSQQNIYDDSQQQQLNLLQEQQLSANPFDVAANQSTSQAAIMQTTTNQSNQKPEDNHDVDYDEVAVEMELLEVHNRSVNQQQNVHQLKPSRVIDNGIVGQLRIESMQKAAEGQKSNEEEQPEIGNQKQEFARTHQAKAINMAEVNRQIAQDDRNQKKVIEVNNLQQETATNDGLLVNGANEISQKLNVKQPQTWKKAPRNNGGFELTAEETEKLAQREPGNIKSKTTNMSAILKQINTSSDVVPLRNTHHQTSKRTQAQSFKLPQANHEQFKSWKKTGSQERNSKNGQNDDIQAQNSYGVTAIQTIQKASNSNEASQMLNNQATGPQNSGQASFLLKHFMKHSQGGNSPSNLQQENSAQNISNQHLQTGGSSLMQAGKNMNIIRLNQAKKNSAHHDSQGSSKHPDLTTSKSTSTTTAANTRVKKIQLSHLESTEPISISNEDYDASALIQNVSSSTRHQQKNNQWRILASEAVYGSSMVPNSGSVTGKGADQKRSQPRRLVMNNFMAPGNSDEPQN